MAAMLTLPLHVVTGKAAGPTFGIITNVHGDEFLPTTAIRALLRELDTTALKGRLAIISVANPMATAGFGRLTPSSTAAPTCTKHFRQWHAAIPRK